MGLPSARHGWMAALLASFLALFVLVSTVEAATCAPENATAHTSETAADAPSDSDDNSGSDQNAICSHGHCHHSGVATAHASAAQTLIAHDQDPAPLRSADRLASRIPTGPDRPPRG